MVLKGIKLVYTAMPMAVLLASRNTLNPQEENNLKVYDTEYHIQNSFTTPSYPPLPQPHENETWDYTLYHNDLMIWEPYNVEIATGGGPEERIKQGEIENPTIEQLITEIKQTEHNLSAGMQLSGDEYSRRIVEVILEQEKAESDAPVEQLVTEIKQTEQKLSLGMQPSTDEYSRRIEKVIRELEVAELSTSLENSEEMGTLEPTEKYDDTSEQTHNLIVSQPTEDSSYKYSNSTFLNKLLRFPSPFITADSIRMRFSGQFLSFLSSEQVIRVLIVLLENELELSNEDQKELIEMMFGHIDYSLELVITKEQVVMLVEAMMRSSVPDYFEQVFLTWKMWYSFTIEEQELMLKGVKREYKKEILVMLYLFVVNRDEDNSRQCEIFKNNIKDQYKETRVLKERYSLNDVVIKLRKWENRVLCTILNTFDICLLDIPVVFGSLDKYAITSFRNFFRKYSFGWCQGNERRILRYKSHVCYAFTKFTSELEQANDLEESGDVETNSRLYFDPVYVKCEFVNWIRMLKKDDSLANTISVEDYKKEFINAFAMIRQVIQSDEYNRDMFFKIFDKVHFTKIHDNPYLILLFSLTNENILRDLVKTKEWAEHIQKRSVLSYKYRFIEDIFINDTHISLKQHLKYNAEFCIVKIHESLSKLNTKESITMNREHYFYRRFLFYPWFRTFNDISMLSYIQGLNKTGQLYNEEQCDQIARDLVFSKNYHEAALKLEKTFEKFGKNPGLLEFKKSLKKECEIYKKKEDIEKERDIFRSC